jgi:predicted nuclease of predicted toxin-antitoxin system
MKIRFQADADLNQIIVLATTRREPTLDFRTADAAGLAGRKDPEVLAIAAGEGRVLVSHDQKTMPRHFAEFILHTSCPGVLIIPQHLSVAAVVEDLLLIWSLTETEEWVNRIRYLPL